MHLVVIGFILGSAVVAFINGKTMDRMEKEIDNLNKLLEDYTNEEPSEFDPTKHTSSNTKH